MTSKPEVIIFTQKFNSNTVYMIQRSEIFIKINIYCLCHAEIGWTFLIIQIELTNTSIYWFKSKRHETSYTDIILRHTHKHTHTRETTVLLNCLNVLFRSKLPESLQFLFSCTLPLQAWWRKSRTEKEEIARLKGEENTKEKMNRKNGLEMVFWGDIWNNGWPYEVSPPPCLI